MEASHVLHYQSQNSVFDQIKFVGFKVILGWLLTSLAWFGKFIFRYTLLLLAKGIIEVGNFFVPFFKLCGKELLQFFLYCIGVAAFSSLAIAFIALVFF